MTARPPSDETERSAIDPETCTPTPDMQGSAPRSLSEARRLAIQHADNAPAGRHAGQDDGRLRDALRIHHPIMRSETGPFSGCRCGEVRLGQDVIAHVVTEIRRSLDGDS